MTERWLQVHDLGLLDYDAAYAFQRDAARRRISGELANDLLILVQHPPVITLGRSTRPANLLASREYLESIGIQVREVERGGDVTVHEPGQLVMYPILDLKQHREDLHWYLRQLEEVVICALATLGIDSERSPGQTGVWREGRKLASIGVHVKQWVTWHGVALNVENDLSTFQHVVPCGIDRVTMTTVAREATLLDIAAPRTFTVHDASVASLAERFGLQVRVIEANNGLHV
ncbi:MAG: lipoyl(octanoyl) transferase LipB [Gemmatimonas sp.]